MIRWFFKEKPWRWRPGFYVLHRWQWKFQLLPSLYMGWSDDGLYDFDDFGLEYCFGPWTLRAVIRDND